MRLQKGSIFKNDLCNQCTPWLDAYLVHDMERDEDISFGNAQTKMLELAMHVLDENQD